MTLVDFKYQPSKTITISEFEILLNSIGMNWYGFENISTNDRDLFEEKTGISFEPFKGMVKLHDLNFSWEE